MDARVCEQLAQSCAAFFDFSHLISDLHSAPYIYVTVFILWSVVC